jgi:heme exporter protein A
MTAVAMNAPTPSTPALQLEALTCIRGDRELFAGIDLELNPGEVLQVEGPNGCGKTSLLRALCGLVPLECGRIRWHGVDVDEAGDDYLGQLTYIGHTPGVKRELTPLENLAVARALSAADGGIDSEQALMRLGLSALADTPLRRLSAGQCRRVALARLLVAPTALWILDEPFTALDADGRALVQHLIAAHCADGGLVVLSTHHALELDAVVRELDLGP